MDRSKKYLDGGIIVLECFTGNGKDKDKGQSKKEDWIFGLTVKWEWCYSQYKSRYSNFSLTYAEFLRSLRTLKWRYWLDWFIGPWIRKEMDIDRQIPIEWNHSCVMCALIYIYTYVYMDDNWGHEDWWDQSEHEEWKWAEKRGRGKERKMKEDSLQKSIEEEHGKKSSSRRIKFVVT